MNGVTIVFIHTIWLRYWEQLLFRRSVWIASIGNFAAVNLMFLYSPVYMSAGKRSTLTDDTVILQYWECPRTRLESRPPFLLSRSLLPNYSAVLKKQRCTRARNFPGGISDRIHCVSEANKFRLFNSVAFFGSALFFIVLGCMPADTKVHTLF